MQRDQKVEAGVVGKFLWQRAILSENGPTSSTTRLVLLALSVFMKTDGSDCWPSIHRLSMDTALSKRTVIYHIQMAIDEGWIEKLKFGAGLTGKHWRRSLYLPKIPSKLTQIMHQLNQDGGASHAPQSSKAVYPTHESGASDDINQDSHLLFEQGKNLEQIACEIYGIYISEIRPRRKSKMRALNNILIYLKRGETFEILKSAILNYKSTLAGMNSIYRKDPANFFSIMEPYAVDFYPENFEPPIKSDIYQPPEEFDFENQFYEE